MTTSDPVPGWYHDPTDIRFVRWWDGSAWTEHVQAVSDVTPASTTSATAPVDPDAELTFAAPSPAHAASTATPEGFLMPDPQATPGRLTVTDVPRDALQQPGHGDAGLETFTSRRERRARESAATTPSASVSGSAELGSSSVPSISLPRDATLTGLPPILPSDSVPTGGTQTISSPASTAVSPTVFPAAAPTTVGAEPVTETPLAPQLAAPAAPGGPQRSATLSAWMLAFSPVVATLLLVGALFAAAWATGGTISASASPLSGLAADPTALAILGGAALLAGVLVLVWVAGDRRALDRWGFERRPSGWWILLGPLTYLIARAVATAKEGRRSTSPVWAHLGIVTAVAALGIAAPFLAPREATVAEMRTVETSVSDDLRSQDLELTVLCPDSSDGRIGSVFVCTALNADDTVVGLITVRWAGVDGSIQYWVELGDLPTEATG